jgi:Ran GTPase-activating protein (RanGAP) involved in mRNA processing and transport
VKKVCIWFPEIDDDCAFVRLPFGAALWELELRGCSNAKFCLAALNSIKVRSLTQLGLKNCDIDRKCIDKICQHGRYLDKCTRLRFTGDYNASPLLPTFSSLPNLEMISLSLKGMTRNEKQCFDRLLENTNFRSFELQRSTLTLDICDALAKALPSMQKLRRLFWSRNILENHAAFARLLSSMQHLSSLTSLTLKFMDMAEESLQCLCVALRQCQTIESFSVHGLKFLRDSVDQFSSQFRSLSLDQAQQGAENHTPLKQLFAAIATCKNLQNIMIFENDVTDDVMPDLYSVLEACPKLSTLDLRRNKLTAEAFMGLASFLVAHTQRIRLETLVVAGNPGCEDKDAVKMLQPYCNWVRHMDHFE